MAVVSSAAAPSYLTNTPSHGADLRTAAEELKLAQEQQTSGRFRDAQELFEKVWQRCGANGGAQDLWLRAAAGLGFADVVLEQGRWSSVGGKTVDQIIDDSLDVAERVARLPKQRRSRALEGQLLLLKSKALFAKPNKTPNDIDVALSARSAAMDALKESAVESLPWSMKQLQKVLTELGPESSELLGLEALVLRLQVLWPNTISLSDEESLGHLALLFQIWSSQSGPADEDMISLHDFLTHFMEVAKRIDRQVDAEPCSHHVPCKANKLEGETYSALEKELVMMISRDGAGNWSAKAEDLRSRGIGDVTASVLEGLWNKLAPVLKKSIAADTEMACGHSCSTCPTRQNCQVHDAVKDIEDL